MGKKKGRFGNRRPYYRGKPLFDILKELPDHGVGRLIKRGSHQNDDPLTPTYMRIIKADLSNPAIGSKPSNKQKKISNNKRIEVLVERTWRGVTHPRTVNICSTSYLADFILIPKEEEEKYIKHSKTAKNYVHWSQAQRKRIKERIAEGMSVEEAKEKEKEMIAKTDAEDGNLSNADMPENSDITYDDNFDEEENEEQSDELTDSEDVNEESEEGKAECEKPTSQSLEKNTRGNDSKRHRDRRSSDRDFDNFTEEQKQRIDKMIQQGMHPDTANQLELERQIGLKSAATGGSKAADRRYNSKRKWSRSSKDRKFNKGKVSRLR
ncbi:probable methyltransferase PMT27 [Ceratitis capitata]|uniref:probable methyltransferase PMT27 n=1 Tax=Ceratitis capitata TaxID=7213 RepID=UPI00032985B0|nr:probable methyltransferase PMT27 [Ceratitis capitata]